MKQKYWGALLIPLLLASTVQAAEKEPSVFVQCDGKPNRETTLGTVARLIAITAVVGLLLPDPEPADDSKRRFGAEGIKACDAALGGEKPASDAGRRMELFFARAIHQVELGNWDMAIADVRAGEKDQPELVATRAYRESLGLTAKHIEAMALTGKGERSAARDAALEMASKAPYNIRNILFALDYSRLDDAPSAEVEGLYDQLIKMFPNTLNDRANYLVIQGRFNEAAEDYRGMAALSRTLPGFNAYLHNARAAISLHFSGDAGQADPLFRQAQADAAKVRATGAQTEMLAAMSQAEDFYALVEKLAAGDAKGARTLFAARSRWDLMPVGFPAELSRRLDAVSSEDDRHLIPIVSPEKFLSDNRDWAAAGIDDAGKKGEQRWRLFHDAFTDGQFSKFSANVWRTEKSRYLDRKADPDLNARLVSVSRTGTGIPGSYAMYLHAALMAKAEGKKGFMMLPGGQRLAYAQYIRIGSPGDQGIVDVLLFDADKVINDLAPYFPKPVK